MNFKGQTALVVGASRGFESRRSHILISLCPIKNHLWSSPVVFPFCRYLDVLRQSSAACKAL